MRKPNTPAAEHESPPAHPYVWRSEDTASAPRNIPRRLRWALLIALVGPALTFVALPAALPQLAADFGGGPAGQLLAQRVQTFPFLGLAAGGLLAGAAVGLMGYARLLIIAALAYFAAGALGLVASAPGLLLTGCVILGLAASLLTCNLVAVAGHVLAETERPRMLGFQTAISDFSTVAGSILGGLLAQHFGWHGPFLLYTLYGALMLALAVSLPSGNLPLPERQTAGLWRTALPAWPTYAAAVCVFLLVGTQTTQLPFFMATKGLASAPVRSIVLTCSTLAAMVGAIIYGLGQARLGTRTLRIAATALACTGFVGLTFWPGSLALACWPALAIGLSIGVTVPALFAAALHQAAPAVRAHAVGLLNSSIFLGSFLSPYVFTPIAQRAGYPALFTSAALLAFVLGGLAFAFSASQARYRRCPT